MKYFITISAISLIISIAATGQDLESPTFLSNEVSFGIGPIYSFEQSLFNLDPDQKGGVNLGVNLDYFYNFDEKIAAGIGIYGYIKSVEDFWILSGGNLKKIGLDFTMMNLAAEGRYTFMRGQVEPYALAHLCYSAGSLENDELGKLNLNGFSAGAGCGIGIPISEAFEAYAEGVVAFGTAKWKEQPFLNSDGKDFNPSLAALFLKIAYRFE